MAVGKMSEVLKPQTNPVLYQHYGQSYCISLQILDFLVNADHSAI